MIGTESNLQTFVVGNPTKKLAAIHRNELKTLVIDSLNQFSPESYPVAIMHVCCARCEVPRTGRRQFLGHMAISHEISLRDADDEWARLTQKGLLPYIAENSR